MPANNAHSKSPDCWIRRKMMGDRRDKNIHNLIYAYVKAGKDFSFIKRVIPSMNDQQYRNALTRRHNDRILDPLRPVALGSRREMYHKSESEMNVQPVYPPEKLKGWERKMFLANTVTFFPLFTYEE